MKYKILAPLFKFCTCPRTSKLKFSTCPECDGTRSDKSGMVFPQPCVQPAMSQSHSINSFPASSNFCCLFITFANILDLDQDWQIGPGLDPNHNYTYKILGLSYLNHQLHVWRDSLQIIKEIKILAKALLNVENWSGFYSLMLKRSSILHVNDDCWIMKKWTASHLIIVK